MNETQLAALKADIMADPVLAGWAATGAMAQEIAAAYNVAASPAWTVWRTSVTADEWVDAILYTPGAGLQLDGLSAGKRDCLMWAFGQTVNPSVPAARATLDDWCGSQNTLKGAVLAVQKRTATRGERLFSTGTGSSASPATMTHEGPVTYQHVEAALALE